MDHVNVRNTHYADSKYSLAFGAFDKERRGIKCTFSGGIREASNFRYRVAEQTDGHLELERMRLMCTRVLEVHEKECARHRILYAPSASLHTKTSDRRVYLLERL